MEISGVKRRVAERIKPHIHVSRQSLSPGFPAHENGLPAVQEVPFAVLLFIVCCSFSLSFSVPELYRCNLVHLLKYPVKMLYILVSHGLRDTLHRSIAAAQHRPRLFHPHLFQDIPEGHAGFLLDIFGEIGLGEEELLG